MKEQGQTTIHFIRHTEVFNPDDILYARLPRFKISGKGLREAEVTAQVLAEEPVSAIYSSPRLRARQTARILAQAHPEAEAHQTRLLDEVLTSWQGRPQKELEAIGYNFYNIDAGPLDETIEDVWARIHKFVTRARKRHPGGTVVAITHGDPVIIARAGYLRMPLTVESLRRPNIYPGHGSLTRLVFPPELWETYPIRMEYYDPNGETDSPWTRGWVDLEELKGLAA